MKMWLIIAAAALQLLVLAYIAGERETVLLTGRTVYLRTAPVDPRDLFRGDYVTLNYEINSLRRDRVHDEAYFVEQGKGRELESRLSRTAEVQVPLEMEVKLAGNGLAVLKGYRWSPLGIGLTLDTDKERHATGATVRLLNSSDKELAIVDLPGGRSFTLDTDTTWNPDEKTWRWVGADTPRPAVAAEQVHMLKPRESHVFKFDFADPAWFIARPGEKPMPIGQFKEWQSSFRLLYRPPAEDAVRGLPNAETIWHGELPSRAFSGGRVD